jgi:uncharacterized delta-60 repeat protein
MRESCVRTFMSRTRNNLFRRLSAVVIASLFVVWSLPSRAEADAGDVNTLFGNGGKVVADFFSVWDEARDVAIQRDGKIVAAGFTQTFSTGDDFAVVRFTANGELDQTFGVGGKVTTDFLGGWDESVALAIQPDGRIVCAGFVFNGVTQKIESGIARLKADGSLDTGFGNGGKVTDDFKAFSASASSVIVQPDSRIVVAGSAEFKKRIDGYADDAFVLARLNNDGSFDETFGSHGRATQDLGELSDEASAVAIGSDGRLIVAGGSASFQTGTDFVVVCFENDLRFPQIGNASVTGKKLLVEGHDFDDGAVILLNGEKQKTATDGTNPQTRLIAKKAGKKIKSGDRLQVLNSSGVESGEYVFP